MAAKPVRSIRGRIIPLLYGLINDPARQGETCSDWLSECANKILLSPNAEKSHPISLVRMSVQRCLRVKPDLVQR